MYSRIAGTGSYLPDKVVTNFDLEKTMDTTDEWIRTRTGIERRHIVAEGQTTVDMANGPVQRVQPFPDTIALLESLGAKNNHRCVGC